MISFISHSPLHSLLAVGTDEGLLYFLNSQSLKILSNGNKVPPQHKTGINHISWHPTLQFLISVSNDSFVVYHFETIKHTITTAIVMVNTTTPTTLNAPIFTCAFSPNGHLFAVGSFDQSIDIYKFSGASTPALASASLLSTISGAHSEPITSLEFNSDCIISSSYDGNIRYHSLTTLKPTKLIIPSIEDKILAPISSFSQTDEGLLITALNSVIYLLKDGLITTFKGHVNIQYCIRAHLHDGKIYLLDEDSYLHSWSLEDPNLHSKELIVKSVFDKKVATYHPSHLYKGRFIYGCGDEIYSK